MTNGGRPQFHFEYDPIEKRGWIIAVVRGRDVTTSLTVAQTRLLRIALKAWDADGPHRDSRGERTYAVFAAAYSKLARHCETMQADSVGQYMHRMQAQFRRAWRRRFPRRVVPRIFDRLGRDGARLAIAIPPKNRSTRSLDVLDEE